MYQVTNSKFNTLTDMESILYRAYLPLITCNAQRLTNYLNLCIMIFTQYFMNTELFTDTN